MIPDESLQAKASRIEVLSTSKKMPTELQHLKVFIIMQTALDLNLRIISKKYLAGVLSMPPLVIEITKGSIQCPRCSSSK